MSAGPTTEQVTISRPSDDRLLMISGRTVRYAVEPRGEWILGLVESGAMRVARGREHHSVRAGQVVAWDPGTAHRGWSADGPAWDARLLVISDDDLRTLAGDQDGASTLGALRDPVLDDAGLAARFRLLYEALSAPTRRLEADVLLSDWLDRLVARGGTSRRPRSRSEARTVERARQLLRSAPADAVTLDELAAVAGVDKYRLVRLFRAHTGLPPHAFQIALRIRTARRLLESGVSAARAAAEAGFTDQAHLTRHFGRTLGMTPRQYQQSFVAQHP